MILYFYFARKFAFILTGMFGIFLLLFGMLDLMEVLRRFSSTDIGFLETLILTSLRVPQGLYGVIPLIVILSTLALFLNLARTNELVITRGSGRSAMRSLISPVLVAMTLGLLAITVFNPIVAATSKQYESLVQGLQNKDTSVLSVSREGLWLRQGTENGQTVIRATRANLDGTELFNVTFLGFTYDGVQEYRIEAESARLVSGSWVATNVKQWQFTESINPEKNAIKLDSLEIPSDLTVEEIRNSFGAPSSIPIWELPAFINRLEYAGFSARRHRVWLQTELAQPLFLAAMVIIGAGFTMRPTRFGRTGIMVLLAIAMGFAIYFIRNLAQILGENGQIPILLSAWAPPIAAILLALGLVLHMEDG